MIYLKAYFVVALICFVLFSLATKREKKINFAWLFRAFVSIFTIALAWPLTGLAILWMNTHRADCAWCGTTIDKDPKAVRAHIMQCEKHPMRAEMIQLKTREARLFNALVIASERHGDLGDLFMVAITDDYKEKEEKNKEK